MSRRQTHAARTGAPPPAGWFALLAALALVAGCFDPRYQSGRLLCAGGPGGSCPGGFYCADDNRCWREGEQPPPPEQPEVDSGAPDGNLDLPPSAPPVLVTPASATPSPVTGTTTMLSVRADDPAGEGSGLIYHWSVTGPGTVGFSVNSSALAQDTTAIFTKAGHYTFTVNIFNNRSSQSISSTIELDVQARLNDLAVDPLMGAVALNGTLQLTAVAFDQFGERLTLATQPRWLVAGTCGTVNDSGLFTGGMTPATGCNVLAQVGTILSVATVAVGTAAPPPLVPVADTHFEDGQPDKNFGTTTALLVKSQNDTMNNRIAYLKFSLAGVNGPIGSAKFRLFGRASGGTTHQHAVFAVSDTAWSETALTFRNRPALGAKILQIGVTTAPKYHEWDLTSHLQARLAAGDMLITLAVQMVGSVTVEPDSFDSKEATNKPQLVLLP